MKVLARLNDNEFPNHGYDHTRKIVRAICYNDKKQIGLIRLKGDDMFGHRDYLETPGGGVKNNEDLISALKREIKEELGADIDNIVPLGRIIDYYNLINRRNDNHYYLAHITAMDIKDESLTSFEKEMFQGVEWYDIDSLLKEVEKTKSTPIWNVVKQREIIIYNLAKDKLKLI